jgi:hypothetical protein
VGFASLTNCGQTLPELVDETNDLNRQFLDDPTATDAKSTSYVIGSVFSGVDSFDLASFGFQFAKDRIRAPLSGILCLLGPR